MLLSISERNVQNIYLRIAMACSDYFLPADVPTMLDEFIPLFTQTVSNFVPPYLALLSLWCLEEWASRLLDHGSFSSNFMRWTVPSVYVQDMGRFSVSEGP